MVWRLARSEASPASQPGPVAHKSHKHRWGRATWRHSDGARAHSQMPPAQHRGGPGSDATSPRGTRPGRVSVARPDREWPGLALRDSEVASPGPGRRSQIVAFARHFARARLMCRVIESPGPRKLSSRPSLHNYSLHLICNTHSIRTTLTPDYTFITEPDDTCVIRQQLCRAWCRFTKGALIALSSSCITCMGP